MSCAVVRFYVAKYTASGAELWARSRGATDTEIESVRHCLRDTLTQAAAGRPRSCTMTKALARRTRMHGVTLLLGMLSCVSAVHAQGVTNARDGNGNLVRNNGIAAQYAPRPMINNAAQIAQQPSNTARPPVIVLKRQ
jgi:hypothetical protein